MGRSISYHWLVICPIHVVTFTLITILATDYIQKRRGQALFFSFEYNMSPKIYVYQSKSEYMDKSEFHFAIPHFTSTS